MGYLNELVVLMERLQRLNELVAKGTADEAFTKRLDLEVLQFFNPILSDKRNHNHHELYLGYPRETLQTATGSTVARGGKAEEDARNHSGYSLRSTQRSLASHAVLECF